MVQQKRKKLLQTITEVLEIIKAEPFDKAITEVFLLGSMITPKKEPNDIDVMLIGPFAIENKSVLRSQEEIRERILLLTKKDNSITFSINFGESIESIVFLDGAPIESYLMIYSKNHTIDWKVWFDENGNWNETFVNTFGILDTHVLRIDKPETSKALKIYAGKEITSHVEAIKLPKEAIWTFLHKRFNQPMLRDTVRLFQPENWTGCKRSGNCCKDFNVIRYRFMPEIPGIYDKIVNEFNSKLWNTITIESEAKWYWLVEKGLTKKEREQIEKTNPRAEKVTCPFLQYNAGKKKKAKCLIYDSRPRGCRRFPEYAQELLEFNCG